MGFYGYGSYLNFELLQNTQWCLLYKYSCVLREMFIEKRCLSSRHCVKCRLFYITCLISTIYGKTREILFNFVTLRNSTMETITKNPCRKIDITIYFSIIHTKAIDFHGLVYILRKNIESSSRKIEFLVGEKELSNGKNNR